MCWELPWNAYGRPPLLPPDERGSRLLLRSDHSDAVRQPRHAPSGPPPRAHGVLRGPTQVPERRHPHHARRDGGRWVTGSGDKICSNSNHLPSYILTYIGPWLLLEHRPCTTSLQRLLSWAILSSCFQLSPVCVMSASRSRRQVFFGLPLFRLPWWFHGKACLVMLLLGFFNVWPSHPIFS